MTDSPPVRWHVADGVGHFVLNRPEAANAIDVPTARAFAAAVDAAVDAAASAGIGAVLLSSTGNQFCAGGDIQAFVRRRDDLDRLIAEIIEWIHPAILKLASLPVPVIGAVHASVAGAGIGVALCADVVLASTAMKLRGGYSAIGLSPDAGTSYFLSRRAGAARAKYLLMTNRTIGADECLRLGLVDEVHPPEALPSAAADLAASLARGATGALGRVKRLCDDAARLDLGEHLDRERQALLDGARSEDGREGIAAFVEKRAPRFSGGRLA
ncbi:MAG TPA: enoyl-CoA hydratase-related protein [Burkholderiaceae bacterium]|nr:enoyl-CoA hydratase-related protein [Burkholderiaceae bacterium]